VPVRRVHRCRSRMIAVIFELEPAAGAADRYFELAAALRPQLEGIDGFVSVERFESLSRPGRYLSLSLWRDEEAVRAWRCHGMHRGAQQEARSEVLAGYRLRVAAVMRDYGLLDREQAPADSLALLI
jgi:heme-degrading monooxygenase HmoA